MIPATNLSEERTVRNTNALTSNWTYTGYLYRRGTGGKTGSTDEAGKCLVETAKDGDTYLISVILGSRSGDGRQWRGAPRASSMRPSACWTGALTTSAGSPSKFL